MKHNYSYQSDKLLLRPLEEQDIEQLRLLRNRPENRTWFFYSGEISAEAQRAWYQRYLSKENDFMFAAALPSDPTGFVGAGAIYDYRSQDDSFEIGRLLIDSRNPACRGLGKEVICGLCQIVDTQISTLEHRCALRAEVYSDNERSLRCFYYSGFGACGQTDRDGRQVTQLWRA